MAQGWDNFIKGSLYEAFDEGFQSSAPATFALPSRGSDSPRGWDFLVTTYAPQPTGGGKVDPGMVVAGLVQRGLPQHVAEGFAMNIADESGFDTGINEIAPLVPGSRGGFGLNQWTGPRRVELEKLAGERGVAPSDFELQLDNIVRELDTTERRARDAILATGTAGEAAAAVVNKFLRPAEVHRVNRTRKYLSSGGFNL